MSEEEEEEEKGGWWMGKKRQVVLTSDSNVSFQFVEFVFIPRHVGVLLFATYYIVGILSTLSYPPTYGYKFGKPNRFIVEGPLIGSV